MPERHGYTSFHGDPVDRHGRPEHHSGRVNHQHMDAYANRDSLNFDRFARHHPGELYSTTSTDYQNIPPREHPDRSEPSQISERRTRGYNPAWKGSVRSSGSSPQIRDESYAGKPMLLVSMRVLLTPAILKTKVGTSRLAPPWAIAGTNTNRSNMKAETGSHFTTDKQSVTQTRRPTTLRPTDESSTASTITIAVPRIPLSAPVTTSMGHPRPAASIISTTWVILTAVGISISTSAPRTLTRYYRKVGTRRKMRIGTSVR